MRITINLASRPYVELGSVVKKLRIAMAVLGVVAIGMAIWTYTLDKKDKERQSRLDAINAQTAKLQAERSSNEARMKQPQNAAELARSQFLNQLFARKSFSWTAVLMDLENVLPPGLQVSNIEPQIHVTGDVLIRMRVAGDRDRAVDLIRNLEKSKHFVAPRLTGESAEQQKDKNAATSYGPPSMPGNVEFEILSGYNPLEPREKSSKEKSASEKNAGETPVAKKPAVQKTVIPKTASRPPAMPQPVTGTPAKKGARP